MAKYNISNIPHRNSVVLKQISANPKGETDSLKYRIKFASIRQNLTGFQKIHTDGSKYDEQAACDVVNVNYIFCKRLPNREPINSAEAEATQMALRFLQFSEKKVFTFFIDSKSVPEALETRN